MHRHAHEMRRGCFANDPNYMAEAAGHSPFGNEVEDVPDVGIMQAQAVAMPEDLAPWCLHWGGCDFTDIGQGCDALRLSTGSVILWFRVLGRGNSACGQVLVSGPWPHAVPLPHREVSRSEVLYIRPGAARAVFGLPVSELTGRRMPLEDLLPGEGWILAEMLLGATTVADRRGILCGWVRSQLTKHARSTDAEIVTGVATWLREPGRLAELEQRVGGSRRQVERWFSDTVGYSPRTLCKLWRVGRVVREAIASASPEWTTLACTHGFSDQAHLVRQWGEIIGMSPARFHRRWRTGGRWVQGMVLFPHLDVV